MTYFASSSFCFFFIATNKNNQKTIDKTFSITHDTLIQLVASSIHNNPTFQPIQNKTILTTLGFHDVFAKSVSPHHPCITLTHFPYPSLFAESWKLHFKPSHWSLGHMAHHNFWLAHYHSKNLYSLACLHDVKITHYTIKPCSILLKNILY